MAGEQDRGEDFFNRSYRTYKTYEKKSAGGEVIGKHGASCAAGPRKTTWGGFVGASTDAPCWWGWRE